eukprot:1325569-Amorphochlora_amoeboformis.AAC.1
MSPLEAVSRETIVMGSQFLSVRATARLPFVKRSMYINATTRHSGSKRAPVYITRRKERIFWIVGGGIAI